MRCLPSLLIVLAVAACSDAEERNASRIRALHRAGDFAGLAQLLDSADPDLRCRAAKTLAWARGPELAPIHVALLSDRQCDWRVRSEAAWRLIEEEPPDVVPALTAALADPAPEMRWNVARALGFLRNDAARPALARCMSDPDKFVAAWCRWADCKIAAGSGCTKPNMNLTNGKPAP